MKGDFSRNTYRPASQYSRVMMQQGRVQIDADWNEQTSILLDYMRTLTRDFFGEHAGPEADCGFRIVTSVNKDKLLPGEDAIFKAAIKNDKKDLGDDELLILPGRYYVGGIPVLAPHALRYSTQSGAKLEGPLPDTLTGKNWLAYLDVWEDYVSADQDGHIREVALDGPDSCGRARVNWRVRLMFGPKATDPLAALARKKPALLKIEANRAETGDTLCSIDPDARYRGVENQLYRIEIQTGSEEGKPPTFKWSRDNGSVTFPVTMSQGTTVTLAHLGRDEAPGLVVGDWVELIDDARMAAFGVGQMAQVGTIDPHDLVVTLKLSDPANSLRDYDKTEAADLHALLRRWDQRGEAITAKPDEQIELEDGIIATFKEGDFRAGDYWYIPARVQTGDVEWEGLPGADGFRPPDGPHHLYAPLASNSVEDLRCQIKRLPCITA